METVTLVLLLLLAVVLSGFVVRLSPCPVVAAIGADRARRAARLWRRPGCGLEPSVFFLLFLPPLLFLDGWRIPKRGFFRDFGTISALAIGLVVVTVLGMGLSSTGSSLHAAGPRLRMRPRSRHGPGRGRLPSRRISALSTADAHPRGRIRWTRFRPGLPPFAITAALTGAFSLSEAFLTFLQLALGGVAIGVTFALAVGFAQDRLTRRIGEDPGTQILISILLPFGAYLAAELCTLPASWPRSRQASRRTTSRFSAGRSPPPAFGAGPSGTRSNSRRTAHLRPARGATAVHPVQRRRHYRTPGATAPGGCALCRRDHDGTDAAAGDVGLDLAEFVLFGAARRGEARQRPDWRLLAVTSLAGTKGAVTLAGILTLPLTMPNGSPFPARELAICLVMGTILLSLWRPPLACRVWCAGSRCGRSRSKTRRMRPGKRRISRPSVQSGGRCGTWCKGRMTANCMPRPAGGRSSHISHVRTGGTWTRREGNAAGSSWKRSGS